MDRYNQNDTIRRHLSREALTASAAAAVQARRANRTDLVRMARMLYHADPVVRADTVKNLTSVGTRDAIPYICQVLNDRDYRVRSEACLALGHLRAIPAKAKLYDALNDPNPQVQCAAALALARMGDKYGFPQVARLVCAGGAHQILALQALCQITGQKFSRNPRGLKEAIRWLRSRQKHLGGF
ncbi:MAG: HEAT repeat domain-containing protein [Sedimentisphaerales bacterium]|nr:HEAT repeat domain-containing protein [Sedimentisphaerales bacterium]